jgi:hypothetical protein
LVILEFHRVSNAEFSNKVSWHNSGPLPSLYACARPPFMSTRPSTTLADFELSGIPKSVFL